MIFAQTDGIVSVLLDHTCTKGQVLPVCRIFLIRSLKQHLAAIFGSDWRCSSPVDTVRNLKNKINFLAGHLVIMFRDNGWSSARSYPRDFSVTSDINCWESGAFCSTNEKSHSLIFKITFLNVDET